MQSIEAGQRHREREAARSRKQSRSVRDIAPMPPIKNPQRRKAARKSLRVFLETYLAEKFKLAWSKNHLEYIAELEKKIKKGGKKAIGMPRGEGKTAITVGAGAWALYNAFRRYIVLVGTNKDEAKNLLDSIKNILTNNKLLLEDYPEIAYPIAKLNGSALLARGQLYIGDLTNIDWKGMSVTLPTIKGSEASGSKVSTAGIFGAIRGKNTDTADGEMIRPDLVLIDDPQTDQMARSQMQIQKAEDVINKAICGLAGPGKEITVVMTLTVIEPDDLSDRYLNKNIYPQWNGTCYKMVKEFPKNMQLWEQYKELRKNGNGEETEFYKMNLEAMQEGAVISWEANHTPEEIDALQHAMNKWADDYSAFMSECQNEPLRPDTSAVIVPSKKIRSRLNGLDWQTLPLEAQTLTGFIDVHDDLLYYVVAAWADDFTGFIIDYGTYPKQSRRMFSKSENGLVTLNRGGERKDGAIQAGLVTLIKDLLAMNWDVEGDRDGAEHVTFSKLLIDTGYKPELVENAIRLAVGRSTVVMPSKGNGIKSSYTPMMQWKRKPGERMGNHWVENTPLRRMRTITVDTNYWKCQVHDGFSLSAGNRGGITLWGRDAETHRMFSEHLNGEVAKLVKTGENEVNEWFAVPNKDNHLFDCMVGCMVAASVVGIKPAEEKINTKTVRGRIAQ